ncbi:MAG: hypothetical protein ACO3UW_05915 [Candidatus Nanopelagicales bacterium]
MDGAAEVLDHGTPRGQGGPARIVATSAIAGGLAIAAVAAGLTWWSGRPPTSPQLEIVTAPVVASTPVTVVAAPPVGALATPAGAALPGISMRLTVGGDPGDSVEVVASEMDALVYVQDRPAVVIAPGGYSDIDITIAPVDCALAREGTDLDEAGYRWRRPFGVEILATTSGTVCTASTPLKTGPSWSRT